MKWIYLFNNPIWILQLKISILIFGKFSSFYNYDIPFTHPFESWYDWNCKLIQNSLGICTLVCDQTNVWCFFPQSTFGTFISTEQNLWTIVIIYLFISISFFKMMFLFLLHCDHIHPKKYFIMIQKTGFSIFTITRLSHVCVYVWRGGVFIKNDE